MKKTAEKTAQVFLLKSDLKCQQTPEDCISSLIDSVTAFVWRPELNL